jgi:hypothetical protein
VPANNCGSIKPRMASKVATMRDEPENPSCSPRLSLGLNRQRVLAVGAGGKAPAGLRRACAARPHTPVRGMADNLNPFKTSPEQYLERAKIIRWQVGTMSNADVCRQLLDIAERYEELADGIERPRRG